jgi:HK97 family phage prohead protease
VLGKMVDGEETDAGLWSRFEVVPGEDGDRLLARLKGGYLNGLSIGYQPVGKAEYEDIEREDGVKESIRHLRRLKLFEVSAVIWGMNPNAVADGNSVKQLHDWTDDELAAEVKRREAKATADAAAAMPTLSPEDADALRARLLSVRLRPILSRYGGVAA